MNNDKYDNKLIGDVILIYIVAIVIWIILIFILELYLTDYIGLLILTIPIIFFIISMVSFDQCEVSIENEIFQYDLLAFGVVIITVFLSLKYPQHTAYFYKLIFVGVLLLGLSMIDVWVPRKYLVVHKHIRGILQTLATTIFIYLFYVFYYLGYKYEQSAVNPFIV